MWTEVTRSDAVEMIIHHITTLLLLILSHISNLHHIGCITLIIHDISDVFLESAKCCNYISKTPPNKMVFGQISDGLFAIFAITFFITRLILFPILCVYPLVMQSTIYMNGTSILYYMLSSLYIVLLCLHVFWFYLIAKMIYKLLTTGTIYVYIVYYGFVPYIYICVLHIYMCLVWIVCMRMICMH